MVAKPLQISWTQQRAGGVLIARWYCRAPARGACGGVWQEDGLFRAEVWPRGRDVVGAYYRTPKQAMRHIERWLAAHPHVADVVEDRRGISGRLVHRPDHRLAEFLRMAERRDRIFREVRESQGAAMQDRQRMSPG